MNPRLVALEVLTKIPAQNIRSSLEAKRGHLSPQDHSLVAELCYGICRHYYSLDYKCRQLLARGSAAKDKELLLILMMGIYQLEYTRIPAYAAVNETVSLAKRVNKVWAVPLLNACLRGYRPIKIPRHQQQAYYDHPLWFIDAMKKQFSRYWHSILAAGNLNPPLVIRINSHLISRTAYANLLQQAGLGFYFSGLSPLAIRIDPPVAMNKLPGYDEGLFCVQDLGAQLAARLLDPQVGEKVLDACAAPGNKSSHLLIHQAKIRLHCADNDKQRLESLKRNLTRMRLLTKNVTLIERDLRMEGDEEAYDKALLDIPCSATGMISRYPEIKLKKYRQQQQALMLRNCLLSLKPGGTLLYVSCSLLRQENDAIIAQQGSAIQVESINSFWGIPLAAGRQLLPGSSYGGFYYCLLTKKG